MADSNNPEIETYLFVSYKTRNNTEVYSNSNSRVKKIANQVALEEKKSKELLNISTIISETQHPDSYAIFGNFNGKPSIESVNPDSSASPEQRKVFESVHSKRIIYWCDYSKELGIIALADKTTLEIHHLNFHLEFKLSQIPQVSNMLSTFCNQDQSNYGRTFRICWSNYLCFIDSTGAFVSIDLRQFLEKDCSKMLAENVKAVLSKNLNLIDFVSARRRVIGLQESGIIYPMSHINHPVHQWKSVKKKQLEGIGESEVFTSLLYIKNIKSLLVASKNGDSKITVRLLDSLAFFQKDELKFDQESSKDKLNVVHQMMFVKEKRLNFVVMASTFKVVHILAVTNTHLFLCLNFHPIDHNYIGNMKLIDHTIVCAGFRFVKLFKILIK